MNLEEYRRFYAEGIRLAAGIDSAPLVEAFARVPREQFLGPGPWRMPSMDGATLAGGTSIYTPTVDADPRHVYHNVPVAIDVARELHNGQPATLARFIAALDLKRGDRVFHLGCGVGYYTAIIADVVGKEGHVSASEVDVDLAARAKEHLAAYANVQVHAVDGASWDPGPCDAMLINAGVTHPSRSWLANLRDGGRMVLPITISMGPDRRGTMGKGVMLRIAREGDRFPARVITFVAIYSCTSARDPQLEPPLGKAMASGALMRVASVRCDSHAPVDSCVLHTAELCLSTA
jgi:protein-L-isoaspartate(D-aspartate) O-methyltransferase